MATLLRHALIIEDDVIIALELELLLRELGLASVEIARSPQEALTEAMRRRPDLITADVQIIGGTGIEAIQAIVRELGEIPYFFVTGNLDMLRNTVAPAVVEKPISHQEFRRAFETIAGAPSG